MKKLKYLAGLLLLSLLFFTGCNKYLDVEPKGRQLLKTTEDFNRWLNSPTLVTETRADNILDYMTDNIDLANIGNPPSTLVELIYTWAPQFTTDISTATLLWGEHYQRINLFNTVLLGIDAAEGGTASERLSIRAEALLGRAYSYYYLVNEYGKPYNPATAATDLAVPIMVSDNVGETAIPPRSTVAEIYQLIIDDINAAIPDLPDDNSSARFRGSKAAAYSVLARVYLYRREYNEAQRYAELALNNTQATMINYTSSATFPTTINVVSHPDVIYGRSSAAVGIPITQEFKSTFESNDARIAVLYYNWANNTRGATAYYAAAVTNVFQSTNSGTSVQEMHLIAAEVAARNNELATALEHLNTVRRNRYTGADKDFNSDDQQEVFDEVLEERRRELPFHGLRWFDMRRFDMEDRMPVVNRFNAANEIVATLEPKSNKYTLQVPVQVMALNPNMLQNP